MQFPIFAPRRPRELRRHVTLIGYPFRATGRGEHLRAIHRALSSVGPAPAVLDLTPGHATSEVEDADIAASLVDELPAGGFRIFHCNGDEAAKARRGVGRGAFAGGYNIIAPAWELPHYPARWARQLGRYDEVWASTRFVLDGLGGAGVGSARLMPNACQPKIERPLGRGHFGLSDEEYVVLFFFDFWSYPARKNPIAVVEVMRQAMAARPEARLRLVLKSSHAPRDGTASNELRRALASLGDRVSVIERTMSDNEIKNLIACCDCFLSLHRSEGFGRGPAEAMFLGRRVIATGWSGNIDYMTDAASIPVGYRLVPVERGEYVEGRGQVWAEPDRDEAVRALLRLIDNPERAKAMGDAARVHMVANYSDEVVGRRYVGRFEEIRATFRG